MEYEIESRQLAQQPAVAKRATLPREEVGIWLQRAYADIFGFLDRAGVAPTGPPYARYTMYAETLDVEAGAPVAGAVAVEGDLVSTSLPGGTVARTIHRGPYEALDEAVDALLRWISERGARPTGPHWENYLNSPQEVPDPASWLTEVLLPYGEEETGRPEG